MSIEFDAILKDGKIEVPAELIGELSGAVHVVLTTSSLPSKKPSKIQQLLDNPIHVEGFIPMTRDEANAR